MTSSLDKALTRISRLAATLAKTECAFIAANGDAPRLKAQVNLNGATGLPLGSLAKHAIKSREPFNVSDAAAEREYRRDPLVTTHPHIRFFASVPIADSEGNRLGALCVGDPHPRERVDADVTKLLGDLAKLAADETELRLQAQHASKSHAQTKREVEERFRLLNAELDHRLKNTLATAQVIVEQTGRSAKTKDEMTDQLVLRLAAMSRAHDLINRAQSGETSLNEIFTSQFEPYIAGREDRLRMQGDTVRLNPSAALALAVAVHELIVNSARFGALSSRLGSIDVSWTIEASILRLSWKESGGPRIKDPKSRGYGLNAIERMLPYDVGASSTLSFEADGLLWEFRAPLPKLGPRDRSRDAAKTRAPGWTQTRSATRDLKGLHVLVVEDSSHIAFSLQASLLAEGATVIGPAATLQSARELAADSPLDVAIIDLNLNDELSFPLIEELMERGIEVIISTGYDVERQFPDRVAGLPVLHKPFTTRKLIAMLRSHSRPARNGNGQHADQ